MDKKKNSSSVEWMDKEIDRKVHLQQEGVIMQIEYLSLQMEVNPL